MAAQPATPPPSSYCPDPALPQLCPQRAGSKSPTPLPSPRAITKGICPQPPPAFPHVPRGAAGRALPGPCCGDPRVDLVLLPRHSRDEAHATAPPYLQLRRLLAEVRKGIPQGVLCLHQAVEVVGESPRQLQHTLVLALRFPEQLNLCLQLQVHRAGAPAKPL